MKDHCLTREANKKSLDKSEDVTRTVEMWHDSFLASDQQKRIVDAALKEGKIAESDAIGILKYWESSVKRLQDKYIDLVNVNVSAYESISLTRINMVAIKPRMPYPLIVPNFPTFIFSEGPNYGMH